MPISSDRGLHYPGCQPVTAEDLGACFGCDSYDPEGPHDVGGEIMTIRCRGNRGSLTPIAANLDACPYRGIPTFGNFQTGSRATAELLT